MFRFLILLALLLSFVPTYAQTKKMPRKILSKCLLTEAPSLRGFFLNQTVNEIDVMMSSFKTKYEEEKESDSNINDKEIGWSYMNFGDMDFSNPELKDVVVTLHFLDDKVIYLSIIYRGFEPQNLKGFIDQLTEKTTLPKEGWTTEDKYHGVLKCSNFQVRVSTGEEVSRPGYLDLPSVTLIDTIAEAEKINRRKLVETKKKNEERKRIRQEREKRTILKP